jgi:hypothetical protein
MLFCLSSPSSLSIISPQVRSYTFSPQDVFSLNPKLDNAYIYIYITEIPGLEFTLVAFNSLAGIILVAM